jgi:asparagine synthase (glutamine-hydrolysing)
MSLFACAIQLDGGRVPDFFRAGIEASPFSSGQDLRWCTGHGFLGAVAARAGGAPPSVVRMGATVAIGVARLDNRREVARWCALAGEPVSDLALAMRYVSRDHGARVANLLGDFAFVVWEPLHREAIAARDTFGVRKLFHADRPGGVLAFASHASLLASGDDYDLQYLVDRAAQRGSDLDRTVYHDVSSVPPAGVLRVQDGRRATVRYWSAAEAQAETARGAGERELCEQFRGLLIEGVRARLSGAETWSHLSGGLDSSSVVSIAEWLARRGEIAHGLAGTVTYTDSLGTSADERSFSDAVVQAYGVRNELMPHRGDVAELLADPPLLDQPNVPYTLAVRDRVTGRIVRDTGGRVLLTGENGDSLVSGTMFFFADWLVSGRAGLAAREMAHRAALGRVSFWELAYENALMPVLPRPVRRWLTRAKVGSIPPWIPRAMGTRHSPASRSMLDGVYGGPLGGKYAAANVSAIDSIPFAKPLSPLEELVDVRHPYLHRPLVELALRLPPEMCVRPHARKWILREAMRGILPEAVRTRVGKGSMDGLNVRSLVHDGPHLDRLLRDPILAQLGCLDLAALRRVLDDVRSGRASHEGWRDLINNTLHVELWLQLRSGRWAAGASQGTRNTNVAKAAQAVFSSSGGDRPGASP